MKSFRGLVVVAIVGALSLTRVARADDTELFTAPPPLTGSAGNPNVLVIIDNSANWDANNQHWTDNCPGQTSSKQGDAELCALQQVVGSLPATVNVGIMFFTAGASTGYVRYGIRPMNAANKTGLQSLLGSITISSEKVATAKTDYSAALFEAFKYFGGYTSPAAVANAVSTGGSPAAGSPTDSTHFGPIAHGGETEAKRDYPGNTNNPAFNTLPGAAFSSSTSTTYQSAITDSCAKNFIIFIGNGYPVQDNGSTLLANVGGNTTVINPPNLGNFADEWSRFLYATDVSSAAGQQFVTTYAISVYNAAPDASENALLQSMAKQGHGRYFAATNLGAITTALQTIFDEVQAVNSVFASVTLPVSVNVRGTNLNQVYLGVFRPDANSNPRWYGNLKQYQLALDSNNQIFLGDAQTPPVAVESPTTGFVVNNAMSFWTTPTTPPAADVTNGFWKFAPSGNPLTGYDAPDGPIVEKGATAQVMRNILATSQAARNVYTCIGCANGTAFSSTPGAATSFDSTNTLITQSALGAADATETSNIINWVRGTDNLDENGNGVTTDVRASLHGDVLHSRPGVVNYNRFGDNDDVVIFYGANDGTFRAVKGGQKPAAATSSQMTSSFSGYEKWSFVPQEFFGGLKRLRDNAPVITPPSATSQVSYSVSLTAATTLATGLTAAQQATLKIGMGVTGTGIPAGTIVASFPTSTTVTLSNPATAAGTVTATFTSEPKPYFMDGSVSVFVCDQNISVATTADLLTRCKSGAGNGKLQPSDGDMVQLFVSMRRGGRYIYALDVTDPDAPKFLWKKGCPSLLNNTGCDTGYPELGQTWSDPKPALITYKTSSTATAATKLVLIFGAGYDPAYEDQDPIPTGIGTTAQSVGRGIFIVDAADGSVLWRAGVSGTTTNASVSGMTYAIPSDVAALDTNRDGLIDRVYVGDTGGNIWRVDLADPLAANWTVNKLASLGYAQSATNIDRRKFLFPASVVPSSDSTGRYDAVLVGSGDREHPFNGYGDANHPSSAAVVNRFYMLKDRSVGLGWGQGAIGPLATLPVTIVDPGIGNTASDFFDATTTNLGVNVTPTALNAAKGWFITLAHADGTANGEKVVGNAVTLAGTTFFNTNLPLPPVAGVCQANLGQARQYAVNFQNGGAVIDNTVGGGLTLADRYSVHPGGGFLPNPVSVAVKLTNASGVSTTKNAICIGTACSEAPGPKLQSRLRTYWYKDSE
jgi:type IV pilus assembly protein PilY1